MIDTQIWVAKPQTIETNGHVKFSLHLEAELAISALVARRQVTGYLIDQVSDHLGGDVPMLVIDGQQLRWRVPVVLYLTSHGRAGQVGEIEVDGQTGQLFVSPAQIEELKQRAEYLATRSLA